MATANYSYWDSAGPEVPTSSALKRQREPARRTSTTPTTTAATGAPGTSQPFSFATTAGETMAPRVQAPQAPTAPGQAAATGGVTSLPQYQPGGSFYATAPPPQPKTEADAQQTINNMFWSMMGRAPTADETRAWAAGLLFGGRTTTDMQQQLMTYPETQARIPQSQATPYTPGQIPGLDFGRSAAATLERQTGDMAPGRVTSGYEFGGFGDLPEIGVDPRTEGMTTSLMQRILESPESLDPRTLEMMKAQGREEELALSAQRQDALERMGQRFGITESPWLAGQSAEERRARDEALIARNRALDIEAARTGAAERREAAQLGTGFLDAQARRRLAERGQAFGEAATAEDFQRQQSGMALEAAMFNAQNTFNYDRLRTDATIQGAKLDLDRAAAVGDRLALREAVQQQATRLGQSADKLMMDYTLAAAAELNRKYGIDLAAYIDFTQLNESQRQFNEDLAFRIHALDEQLGLSYSQLREGGRQFNVGAGIDIAALQQQARQFGINQQNRLAGI